MIVWLVVKGYCESLSTFEDIFIVVAIMWVCLMGAGQYVWLYVSVEIWVHVSYN